MDPRIKHVADIKTVPLFDMIVDLSSPPISFGETPVGRRVLFGAASGTFTGERVRGEVLAGGGDWAVFRATGEMALDVRLSLRTHDNELIYMTYGGRWITPPEARADMADPVQRFKVDPSRYYFHTQPLFETGSKSYAWLNDIVCIGTGYLAEGAVAYKIFQVT
jgi:hypothetical protein